MDASSPEIKIKIATPPHVIDMLCALPDYVVANVLEEGILVSTTSVAIDIGNLACDYVCGVNARSLGEALSRLYSPSIKYNTESRIMMISGTDGTTIHIPAISELDEFGFRSVVKCRVSKKVPLGIDDPYCVTLSAFLDVTAAAVELLWSPSQKVTAGSAFGCAVRAIDRARKKLIMKHDILSLCALKENEMPICRDEILGFAHRIVCVLDSLAFAASPNKEQPSECLEDLAEALCAIAHDMRSEAAKIARSGADAARDGEGRR